MDRPALRTLGDDGLDVSSLGLGLAALGRPGYINLGHGDDLGERSVEAMRARAFEVLDAAWAAGVRYFDAARSYGRAEAFLGSWLRDRGIRPEQVAVGSKWGYTYTAGWRVDADTHEVKEHSLAKLREQWSESRGFLGDQLDLYQIHSATLDSGVLDRPEVLHALARLKAETGVAIGLSLSGPEQDRTLERALATGLDGERLFDAVQATWNPLEPSAEAVLAAARAAGLGVIVKEALANGRLTRRGLGTLEPAARAALERDAKRLGCSVDAWALAAALARPWTDVVLSGATTTSQLRSNLTALAVGWDLAAEATLTGLAEPPERYWKNRSELPWT